MSNDTLRVVIGVPMGEDLRQQIADVDPRIEVVYDESLFPWARYVGDHHGTPAGERSESERDRFYEYVSSGDVLYGIPELRPSGLRRAIEQGPDLRWVQATQAGAGAFVVAAKLDADQSDRVTVTTAAGVHAIPLAEFAIFGMLAGSQELARLQRQQRAHEWVAERKPKVRLDGATCLIVGMGEIGKAIASRAAAMGMRVLGIKRRPEDMEHVERVGSLDDLSAMVAEADHVVITLPGTEHTQHLVNADLIAAMKSGVTIVNVGRGSVIDETALVAALRSGQVGSAALDVFEREPLPADSPLWDFAQVIISPHDAALDVGEERRCVELFTDNLRRYLDGDDLRNVVDIASGY